MKTVCKYAYVMYDRQDSKKEDPKPVVNVEKKKVGPPGRVTASQGTYSDKIIVNWRTVADAHAYGVYRAEPNSTNFRRVAYAGSDDSSYTDTSIQPDMAYRYRIQSVGPNNRSQVNYSPTAEGYAKKRN